MVRMPGPGDPSLADAWNLEFSNRTSEIEAGPGLTQEPEQLLAQARLRPNGK